MKSEHYYQMRAKELVDTLFDAKLFREDLTRDDMQSVEDLIAFNFETYAKTAESTAVLLYKINHNKAPND